MLGGVDEAARARVGCAWVKIIHFKNVHIFHAKLGALQNPESDACSPDTIILLEFNLKPFFSTPSFHFLTFSVRIPLFLQPEQDHPNKTVP